MIILDLGLKNKRVLVTGASSGIGKTSAIMFAREGATVIVHYNKNKDMAMKLVSELGEGATAVQADLSLEKDVERMFNDLSSTGRIDIIVCNAGIWPEKHTGIVDMDYSRWKKTLEVDLDSVFLCSRAFLKQLISFPGDNGNIIIVGSTAAIFGEANHADYSAAKAAITYGLTRSLKNEIVNIARLGRVNAVCPGWTVTPMTEKYLDDVEGIKNVLKTVPLRKIAKSEDVASMIVFLASNKAAGHISGQIITVAGGMEGRTLFEKEEIEYDPRIHREYP